MTITLQFFLRVVVIAVACAVATIWVGWMAVPVVGIVYGLADRRARGRGSIAALGAVVGWGAILAEEAARGADVGRVSSQLGAIMQMPAVGFSVVTLTFAALLCGTAAVIGAVIGDLFTGRYATVTSH
ncbi:MAG: hypothetical protein ABI026_05515 [Gemmatimonadaceae bacterium]